ncbi:TrbC/VirB2 family protein [Luteimonas sp. BDR2-5]|uniref:TrbC/VirB2 family protein n=1 Tax=Proluteimonas luteida TaxID=2878685 RepID=UPI001E548FE7|nr:TrbC/VirB2 family protein [Luteimonas sp. BDR2-5]MCD9030018.1 TrbC/VirB2 family protein [Luteimonas sp. BDR2-5]
MKNALSTKSSLRSSRAFTVVVGTSLAALPAIAMAQDVSGATNTVNTFFTNITTLLNIASIAIVTIAVIFAGYQIAFNHKRIGDVAPVLIGGFLIGAAAQIARMLLPDDVMATGMVVVDSLMRYA